MHLSKTGLWLTAFVFDRGFGLRSAAPTSGTARLSSGGLDSRAARRTRPLELMSRALPSRTRRLLRYPWRPRARHRTRATAPPSPLPASTMKMMPGSRTRRRRTRARKTAPKTPALNPKRPGMQMPGNRIRSRADAGASEPAIRVRGARFRGVRRGHPRRRRESTPVRPTPCARTPAPPSTPARRRTPGPPGTLLAVARPLPCTSALCAASGANSVQCTNNAAGKRGLHARPRRSSVARDIAQGNPIVGGAAPAPKAAAPSFVQGSCYVCLNFKGCLDDNGCGDTGNECGDAPDRSRAVRRARATGPVHRDAQPHSRHRLPGRLGASPVPPPSRLRSPSASGYCGGNHAGLDVLHGGHQHQRLVRRRGGGRRLFGFAFSATTRTSS